MTSAGLGEDIGRLEALRLEPVRREGLTEKAYLRIRSALMLSHFRAGQRLVLRPLAAELGISPTPVREALLRLVSEHALTLDSRGVVSVPVFDAGQYQEIRDLRLELEGQAAAAAVGHVTAQAIEEIEAADRAFVKGGKRHDFRMAWEANERLHMTLYRLAEMPVLFSLIENLWMRCAPFFMQLNAGGVEPGASQHQIIIRGLRERDPELARRGVRDDIMASWRRLTGSE